MLYKVFALLFVVFALNYAFLESREVFAFKGTLTKTPTKRSVKAQTQTKTKTPTRTWTKTRTGTSTVTATRTTTSTRTWTPSPTPSKTATRTPPATSTPFSELEADWSTDWMRLFTGNIGDVCYGVSVGGIPDVIARITKNNTRTWIYKGECFYNGNIFAVEEYLLSKGLEYSVIRIPAWVATATATKTNTATSTSTNTLIPTKTYTPTVTNTSTATNTSTSTSTFTATTTPTETFTSTATNTPTSTSTPTNTFTPTNTRTSTATSTPTVTSSKTPTITFTPTVTVLAELVFDVEIEDEFDYQGDAGVICAVESIEGYPNNWVVIEFTGFMPYPVKLTNFRCFYSTGISAEDVINFLNRRGENFTEVIQLP